MFDFYLCIFVSHSFAPIELGALVDLHRANSIMNEEPLTDDEVSIIKGALDMKDKEVKDAYVPIDRVFMVNKLQVMDRSAMKQVCAMCYVQAGVGGAFRYIGVHMREQKKNKTSERVKGVFFVVECVMCIMCILYLGV